MTPVGRNCNLWRLSHLSLLQLVDVQPFLLLVLFYPGYLLLWPWPLMSWVVTIHIFNLWRLSHLSLLQLVDVQPFLFSVLFLPRYLLLWPWPLMSWVLTIHILNLWRLSHLSLLQLVDVQLFLLSVLFLPRYLLPWPWPLMSWVLTTHIPISPPPSQKFILWPAWSLLLLLSAVVYVNISQPVHGCQSCGGKIQTHN